MRGRRDPTPSDRALLTDAAALAALCTECASESSWPSSYGGVFFADDSARLLFPPIPAEDLFDMLGVAQASSRPSKSSDPAPSECAVLTGVWAEHVAPAGV